MLCATCRHHLRRSLSSLRRSTPMSSTLSSQTRVITTPTTPPPSSSISLPEKPSSQSPALTHIPTKDLRPPISEKKAERPPSMTPGGHVLRGLGYTKAKPEIHAKEDSEYPEWLWGCLATSSSPSASTGEAGVPLNAKQRKRLERKKAELAAHTTPPVPVHRQTIDLTPADASAVESLQRREEVVKAMRRERRVGIREANFLRGM